MGENADGNSKVMGSFDAEDKLDEDFLFYLAYVKAFFGNLEESQEIELCEAWLHKLCAQSVTGTRAKRSRNIYLSNLILDMLEGQLSGPFNGLPPKGQLLNAIHAFGPETTAVDEEPDWQDELPTFAEETSSDFNVTSADGRTYVASKTLPHGRGAFAFVSITLGEKDKDCGPCEGLMMNPPSPDKMPRDVTEMLASRNPEALRNRLLRFYDNMITKITREQEGTAKPSESVDMMLETMDSETRCQCSKAGVWGMPAEDRRHKMLEILINKLIKRREKVNNRSLALDELEELVRMQQEDFGPNQEVLLQEADADISTRNKLKLQDTYPDCVVRRFNELLKKEKRAILNKARSRLKTFENEIESGQIDTIKRGREKYMTAKKEWMEVAEAVEACRNGLKTSKESKAMREAAMDAGSQGGKHIHRLLEEITKEQHAIETTLENNKLLRELIQTEEEKNIGQATCTVESNEQVRKENKLLRNTIHDLQNEIHEKEGRVKELQQMVHEVNISTNSR